MAVLFWSLLLLAGVVGSANVPRRIIGGEDTTIENWPFMVQVDHLVFIIWTQSCGGIILTSYNILSAAECFLGVNDMVVDVRFRRIRAGATYRNAGGDVANVDRIIIHPNFEYGDGNLAVVRLYNQLTYSPVVQQGTIVAQGYEIPDNIRTTLLGWGQTESGGSSAEVLQSLTVATINRETCAERYAAIDREVTNNMICAGVLDQDGIDACTGDVGGPLLYENIAIGIISWGNGCGNGTFPRVNTAVAAYSDWIVVNAS